MIDFEHQLGDEDDTELGFLPALAAAIPMVTNLAGSLLKGGKDGKPAPEASQAQGVLDVLTRAIGGDESKGETSIKEVIRNIVSTVPSPVIKQVKDAISQMKNAEKSSAASRDLIVNKVDSKFGPQLHALLASLKAQQLQSRATYEHNRLQSKKQFRDSTTKNLAQILKRLTAIEGRLSGSAIVRGNDRIAALGGRYVLER